MRLDSLMVSDTATINDAKNTYSDTALRYIEMALTHENHYNKPEFSWESR